MLADHAFHTADHRPGGVVNERNFHHPGSIADPIIRQICQGDSNQESDLNPKRCVLVWLSFREQKIARVAQW